MSENDKNQGGCEKNSGGNDKNLEQLLADIDQVIVKMQDADLPLEESFGCYKQGLELIKSANEKIEKIQCDIKVITGAEE